MLVFHLGFPKAASSTLQKWLFTSEADFINLGRYPTKNLGSDTDTAHITPQPFVTDQSVREFHSAIFERLSWNADLQRAEFDRLVKAHRRGRDLPIVLSNESFLSNRFSPVSIDEKLRRIASLDRDPKILVLIRNQLELLKSLYRDHPFAPELIEQDKQRFVSFDRFYELDRARGKNGSAHSLRYHTLYLALVQHFGPHNIIFVPMEWLKTDLEAFCEALAELGVISAESASQKLVGRTENFGLTNAQGAYRRLRAALPDNFRSLGRRIGLAKKMDRAMHRQLSQVGTKSDLTLSDANLDDLIALYREENTQLEKVLSVDLNSLDYPTNHSAAQHQSSGHT